MYARLCGASIFVALCESSYNHDRPRELGLLHLVQWQPIEIKSSVTVVPINIAMSVNFFFLDFR